MATNTPKPLEREPGVWLVRTAMVIPDDERWLHTAEASASLREALDWSRAHPANDADVDKQLRRLRNAKTAHSPDHDATYGEKCMNMSASTNTNVRI